MDAAVSKTRGLALAAAWLLGGLLGAPAPAAEYGAGPVAVIDIDGPISDGLPRYVERGVATAEQRQAACLVVHIRSFGGLLQAGASIKDSLLATEVPTLAYVDRRAISAGALIALACDRIAMAPGGTFGAATPYSQQGSGAAKVDEKMISAVRAIFRSTADAKGHPVDLAGAMVDPDVAIAGRVEAGKLLTLSTREAVDAGLASAAASLDALLAAEGLADRERIDIGLTAAEHLANALTNPALSGILLSIGMLALIAAFKIPGTGLPEIAAILAFGGFLFGKHVAGLAGVEDTALIVVGLALLGLEIFVIPGTTVAGVIGALAVMAGVIMAFVGEPTSSPFFARELKRGINALGYSIGGAVVVGTGLFMLLRRTRAWKRFTLERSPDEGPPAPVGVGAQAPAEEALIGSGGTTTTALRPEGEVDIDGRRLPARADRGYLDNDMPIIVVGVDGPRVLVAATEDQSAKNEGAG